MEQNSYRYDYNTQQRSDLKFKFYRIELKKKLSNMGIKPYNNLPSHSKNLKYSTPSKETKTIFIAADPLNCRGTCLKIVMQNVIVYDLRACFKKCNFCKSINC